MFIMLCVVYGQCDHNVLVFNLHAKVMFICMISLSKYSVDIETGILSSFCHFIYMYIIFICVWIQLYVGSVLGN